MKKQLSALLAAALCASALAGCGVNSNSANAATSGAEDTVTLADDSPVTGDSAEYGIHFNVGAQMAADKINEAGGINGKQVVLKSFDSKNDAKEAAEVWIGDDENHIPVKIRAKLKIGAAEVYYKDSYNLRAPLTCRIVVQKK